MSSTFDYTIFSASDTAFLQSSARRVCVLIRRGAKVILEIGNELAEIKKMLPHGQFAAFCRAEMDLEPRTVEHYMSLAELAKKYSPALVAQLPVRAGYQLAEKSVPNDVVAEIMSQVSDGKRFTISEVNNRLEAARLAERSSRASDTGYVADKLLEALDMQDVEDLLRLLGKATRSTIAAFCQQLQQGLEHRRSTTATPLTLPQNQL
jgi:hypothetical protein